MAERREIVNKYVQQGLPTAIALPSANISRSTYYYKPHPGKRGKRSSTHTLTGKGKMVCNEKIIERMDTILSRPFIDYGCDRMTMVLKKEGYLINRKKVYRLMKESQLLYPKRLRNAGKSKEYVKYTVPTPERPYEIVELDIKYIHIAGEGRTGYLVTLFDTFHREALAWQLDYKMKAIQIKGILEKLTKESRLSLVKIRTDNGPQFISTLLRDSLELMGIEHEFIRPGTPEQNGHIESFHSLVEKQVVNHYMFSSLKKAREVFTQFYDVYNNERIMKVLLGMAPTEFLRSWQQGTIGVIEGANRKRFFFREKPGKSHGSSPEDFLIRNSKQPQNQLTSTTRTDLVQLIGG